MQLKFNLYKTQQSVFIQVQSQGILFKKKLHLAI